MNYTMMGDVVNTARGWKPRRNSMASTCNAHRHAADGGPEDFAWRTIDKVKVVGKAEAVETVEILGLQGHLSPQQVELCALYHQGLALYRQQRWDKALALLHRE